MGVDHNLGGRDNDKGKLKRHKKASRLKTEILRTIGKPEDLKKEVVFNEDSRKEWLTGFHKRKQMRRQYGVAMQCLKDKKSLKDAQSSRREAKKLNDLENSKEFDFGKEMKLYHEVDDDEMDNNDVEESNSNCNNTYDDEQTQALFGNAVTVTVDTTNLNNQLDEYHNVQSSENTHKPTVPYVNYKQQAFEKAIKQAKQKIQDKKFARKNKSNRGSNSKFAANFNKGKEGKKLLSKATGVSTYKGKKNR